MVSMALLVKMHVKREMTRYHGLFWLKFEMANLFSKVLGVLDVV